MPTYPVVLPLKGDNQEINLFSERIQGRAVPSMPRLDPNRVVRGYPLHIDSRNYVIIHESFVYRFMVRNLFRF
jgi:hypothetical protein